MVFIIRNCDLGGDAWSHPHIGIQLQALHAGPHDGSPAFFCLPMTKLSYYHASAVMSRIRPVAGVGLDNHNTQNVTGNRRT